MTANLHKISSSRSRQDVNSKYLSKIWLPVKYFLLVVTLP